VRRRRRNDAGYRIRFTVLLVVSFMEFEGRMADLSDQICCVVGVLCLDASRRWQAVVQAGKRRPRIPPNKVCIWSMRVGFLDQILLCVEMLLLAVVLP